MVGHVPFNLAPSISLFSKRDINKAFAEVVGEKVNREELDMDLKSHAYIIFMDPSLYIDKMKELVDSLTLYRPMTRFSVMKLVFPYDQ